MEYLLWVKELKKVLVKVEKVADIPLYSLILFNINFLSEKKLDKLLKELELESLAKFLKTKFNDSRSVNTLKDLIKSEYGDCIKLSGP